MNKKIILSIIFILTSGCAKTIQPEKINEESKVEEIQPQKNVEEEIMTSILSDSTFTSAAIENMNYKQNSNQKYDVQFSFQDKTYECIADIEHHRLESCHDRLEDEICEIIKTNQDLHHCEIMNYETIQDQQYSVTYQCEGHEYECVVDLQNHHIIESHHEKNHHH